MNRDEVLARRHRSRTKRFVPQILSRNQDFKELLYKDQKGCCGICGVETPLERLVLDHDHCTGFIRGLLCRQCNIGLGHLGDDTGSIEKALNYLKTHDQRVLNKHRANT